MTLANVINGKRLASPQREAGGWSIPIASPQDVASALKWLRSYKAVPLTDRIERLSQIGREASWISEDDLRLIATNTGGPIRYLKEAIARINRWLVALPTVVEAHGSVFGAGRLRRGETVYAGGVTTTIVLAGDSSALPAWTLAQTVLAGAPSIVKPSNAEPLSTTRFAEALLKKDLGGFHLLHLDSSLEEDREQIRQMIRNTQQSVVYGEDGTVASIYGPLSFMPAHKPIPYWSGRSGAIVYPDADLAVAARNIITGVAFDRGNKCASTKKVFAPEALAPQLEKLLAEAADQLRRGDPLDEGTEVGGLEPAARAQADRALVEGGEVIYDRDVIIARAAQSSVLLREELPYPVVGLRYYQPSEDPVVLANETVQRTPTGRALVMSVHTKDRAQFERAASELRAFKIVHGTPSTEFDLTMLHQGQHLFLELMRPLACR